MAVLQQQCSLHADKHVFIQEEYRSFEKGHSPFNGHVTVKVPSTCRQTCVHTRGIGHLRKGHSPFNGHVTATVPSTCRQTCV